MKRHVYCSQKISFSVEKRVRRERCSHHKKPARKVPCNTQECPPTWHAKAWLQCSVSCGLGQKARDVSCRSQTTRGSVLLPDSMCQHQPIMEKITSCQMPKCPPVVTHQWTVSSWSSCSVSCGHGNRRREITCGRQEDKDFSTVRSEYCQNIPQPTVELSQSCTMQPCPVKKPPYWYTSPLSQCSVTCGLGTQTRLVHCLDEQTQELSTGCDTNRKPDTKQPCVKPVCPKPDPKCVDEFMWCYLVPKHGICQHKFYGSKCCHSCLGFG